MEQLGLKLNDLNTARAALVGAGNSNFSFSFWRMIVVTTALTESWNGTSWTEVNDLNKLDHRVGGGAGVDNTSALAFGGNNPPGISPPFSANTESWNGTSWTEVNDLNTARVRFRWSRSRYKHLL
jgi:hypothetical protein